MSQPRRLSTSNSFKDFESKESKDELESDNEDGKEKNPLSSTYSMEAIDVKSQLQTQTSNELHKTRRKLSIMSNNKLVDGINEISLKDTLQRTGSLSYDDQEEDEKKSEEKPKMCIRQYAGFSKKGFAPYNPRKKNQDALIMAEHPQTCSILYVVLDGHGEFGELVSGFFQNELSDIVFEHSDFVNDPVKAITESIASMEERLLSNPEIDTDFSGTTLVCALVRASHIYVFNIGDSRITLVTKENSNTTNDSKAVEENLIIKAKALSIDHKPDLAAEKERIINAGGRVFAVQYDDGIDGPPRVWLQNFDIPGLAMSRSLGDAIAHTAGVSSTPEIHEYDIEEGKDMFLILGTDGLWEFITDDEAAEIADRESNPEAAVQALITEANTRWLQNESVIDDTTVCVCYLGQYKA